MLLSLSADCCYPQKNLFKLKLNKPFRSYSHEQIHPNVNHRRTNSSHSVDLFTLNIPIKDDSSLSSLICSICSLPMMKPTLLPCQHTFCYKCIQNNQQIHPGSLPICSNSCLVPNDNQRKIITCQKCSRIHHINSLSDLEQNQSIELLINTLLCETCHQLYSSNQLDTCLHCFGVHCPKCYEEHIHSHQNDSKINMNLYRITSTEETVNISVQSIKPNENEQDSDNQIFKPRSINTEKKPSIKPTKEILEIKNNENENIDPSQTNNTKKRSNLFRKIMKPPRQHSMKEPTRKTSSSSIKSTSSFKDFPRPKIIIDTNIEEPTKTTNLLITTPITPVRRFFKLYDQYTQTAQHIEQCKQRQSELDQAVKKLIEVFTLKTDETINQILQYWIYLKQSILDQFQPKSNRFQLVDYLLKTCCSTLDSQKQIESYFQQNDEINAALQVLSTTLLIINNQQPPSTISKLFDREERATILTLRRRFESLYSLYIDELSSINKCINLNESRFSSWKNSNTTDLDLITYEWTHIIECDYPSLIEKISHDFITEIPQTEKILVQMLRNMKKRLLDMDNKVPNQRTSNC